MPESNVASTYSSLYVHLVFATKDRVPLIHASWRADLHSYIGGTLRGLGSKPLSVGGIADHVHILAGLTTTHRVADLVKEVKRSSTIWAHAEDRPLPWQIGYGVFSVAAPDLPNVISYIEQQEEHHRKVNSADELRAMLIHHGIEIDERYFE